MISLENVVLIQTESTLVWVHIPQKKTLASNHHSSDTMTTFLILTKRKMYTGNEQDKEIIERELTAKSI